MRASVMQPRWMGGLGRAQPRLDRPAVDGDGEPRDGAAGAAVEAVAPLGVLLAPVPADREPEVERERPVGVVAKDVGHRHQQLRVGREQVRPVDRDVDGLAHHLHVGVAQRDDAADADLDVRAVGAGDVGQDQREESREAPHAALYQPPAWYNGRDAPSAALPRCVLPELRPAPVRAAPRRRQ
jgi:hypothetical protein